MCPLYEGLNILIKKKLNFGLYKKGEPRGKIVSPSSKCTAVDRI